MHLASSGIFVICNYWIEEHLSTLIADKLLSFAGLILLIFQDGHIYALTGCQKARILSCTGEALKTYHTIAMPGDLTPGRLEIEIEVSSLK